MHCVLLINEHACTLLLFGVSCDRHVTMSNSFHVTTTAPYWRSPLHCQGWEVSVAVDMHYFYHGVLSEEERLRVRQLELFDEFEVGLPALCVDLL